MARREKIVCILKVDSFYMKMRKWHYLKFSRQFLINSGSGLTFEFGQLTLLRFSEVCFDLETSKASFAMALYFLEIRWCIL